MEADLRKQILQWQSEVERLENDLNEKQAAYDAASTERDETIRGLAEEIAQREQQLDELQGAMKVLEERYANETQTAEERQTELQSQLENKQTELAAAEEGLQETQEALKELSERYANDTRIAEERQAELQSQLNNMGEELRRNEAQMEEEIAAYEAELDNLRNKTDAERQLNEEKSAEDEKRIKTLESELHNAIARIEELNHYMINVEEYTRGAYANTLDGFSEKQVQALEEYSTFVTANMADYSNATEARLQLLGAVEMLQKQLEQTKQQATDETGKLRQLLKVTKRASRNRLAAVMNLVHSAQGVLAETAEVDTESDASVSRAASPDALPHNSHTLADHSNKENDMKRSVSRSSPMAKHPGMKEGY
ncbi:putative OSM3-like kinesin [Trypanosoma theileri]|uniref:Putative OSM3-like kinesin n=1 Tax=Trypanosoma theileri TaxID=67003 RepID=A0A1X0NZ40_9TRYP|nr:putative OSM3-like kinesin [Trypanosoma theileri]ORC89861.1 putative OSM3-like kinesin [Trypanosoma theileri]